MIKYKIRVSDWLTFPLIIVNFNYFFIQPVPGQYLLQQYRLTEEKDKEASWRFVGQHSAIQKCHTNGLILAVKFSAVKYNAIEPLNIVPYKKTISFCVQALQQRL